MKKTELLCPSKGEAKQNRMRSAGSAGRLFDQQQAQLLDNTPARVKLPPSVVIGRLPLVRARKYSVPNYLVKVR